MTAPKFNIRCIVPSSSVNGALAGFEQITVPGEGPPLHTHREESEIFHVIAGRFRFVVGDDTLELGPGGYAIIPPGEPHTFKNIGDTDGVLHFEMVPPGTTEEFFDRLVREFPDITDLAAFFDQYGMDLNGPPL